MPFKRTVTPLPEQDYTPVQVAAADWLDLPGDSTKTIIELENLVDQAITINKVGGRPETGVVLEVTGEARTQRGVSSDRQRYDAAALTGLDDPVDVGPLATQRLQHRVINRSGTDHTQASGTPYQTFLNYTIRELTILEKINRDIPLTNLEEKLAREFGLATRERLSLPPSESAIHKPTLEDKRVITDDAVATTFDVTATGATNATELSNLNVRSSEVVYLTGVQVNSQAYTAGDNLTLSFKHRNNRDFYELQTFAMPGAPYKADLHIPFLDNMLVTAYASNPINDVQVRLEYARVERTLLEKALYGLEEQVKANDDLADRRAELYDKLRTHMQTGLPLDQKALVEATAPDLSQQPAQSSR